MENKYIKYKIWVYFEADFTVDMKNGQAIN